MDKTKMLIIGIIAVVVLWNVGKILLLIYSDDNVDTYWSDGDKYHVGKCTFIDEYNVDGDYPSKQAAETDGLKPCWLCHVYGINLCDILKWCMPNKSWKNFVKDHDFVEYHIDGGTIYCDASAYDLIYKDSKTTIM